jgi:hypothetical protein
VVRSEIDASVTYTVWRMSFARRLELMSQVREMARRMECLEAGAAPGEKMDAALVRGEIDRLFVKWGLRGIAGLELDGADATPEALVESGPEGLFREALAAVRAESGLSAAERKN